MLKDDDFDRLDLGVKNPNIFEILKIAKNEIRHSNFLAWLLSPNQSHKLGFMFLKKFIREVCYSDKTKNIYQIDIERLDLIEAQIKREWKNIDILIELEKIVIAIENKTLSKEGENQLKRYKEIINQEYPDRAKIFVFLTPGRDIPKDKDNSDWETISYEFIVETLDEILTFFGRVLNPKVKNYIEDYKIVIEREFMETDDLTKLSIKIYENHKELFDFINERIPDNVNRLRKIMQSELPNMDWRQGSENKYYVRFYTDKIKDFIYIGPKKFGWKKGESFLFEFALDSSHNRIIFQTIISPCGELYNSKRLEEILQGTDGIDGLDKAPGRVMAN